MANEQAAKIYGISHGNGNNGVSHTFASYYVNTDKPWLLAHCAVLEAFNESAYDFVIESAEIDGDEDYGISVTIFDPPLSEQDFPVSENDEGEFYIDDDPDETFASEEDAIQACIEQHGSWSEHNGAWHITEIFPDDEPRDGVKVYESIEDAFSAELIKKAQDWYNS